METISLAQEPTAWKILLIVHGVIIVILLLLALYFQMLVYLLKHHAVFLLFLLASAIGISPMFAAICYTLAGNPLLLVILAFVAAGLLSLLLLFWLNNLCTNITDFFLDSDD
jgi:hypothetical protein